MALSKINRRDFLNGVALGVAAGGSLSPLELLALEAASGRYPPLLTGLRGSHPGSFEVAHALAWNGATWPRPDAQTDATYDLVVVGAGLSGLAAAWLYRQKAGDDARILVLDNHDDFGGHAKRNEFVVDGRTLICYGGSQSIDTPGHYSRASAQLLKDVGIETERFYDYFDQDYFRQRGLEGGIYFSGDRYGEDSVHRNVLRMFGSEGSGDIAGTIEHYPLSPEARADLYRLLTAGTDYLPGLGRSEKIAAMKRVSYSDFLRRHARVNEAVVALLRDTVKGLWGVGYDVLSALEGYRLGMPGTAELGIGELEGEPPGRDEPYIFHFPDGNAGIARSLVRMLVPAAAPGSTMEDLVLAPFDYGVLDEPGNPTRIRLDSTAVDVRHADGDSAVDVTYVRGGVPFRVRGRHTILACYNAIVPKICPEVPAGQAEAIAKAVKVPLVYISIAVRNWKAFDRLGFNNFYVPQPTLMHSFGMDFPVSMGGYEFTQDPSEPAVIHGTYVPTAPDQGLTEREQHLAGRRALYEMSFSDIERNIVRQLSGALGPGGFDAERDIAAITVNRWPHGYAYEYNELFDPPEWTREHGPHVQGAARIGRISIANSDASAYAYVNGAIDAADRAVNEQLDT
ncbi:MAG: NAD(P)/FAD-dependent oxidoreductase [Gammaproteobacteria bacterium]|nr:NAD(P)/FAD-dependent oxidoreductase [Gammaproteobacteria bacterium]MDH4254115.1 NAD(P)/FAD-dependent oxidoreductase [Gammaproteobacteria bacterium]MDH5309063.1 NAD(P)/FAD-dependent oxidoreductase [Gammaproteobacteria bacterium]